MSEICPGESVVQRIYVMFPVFLPLVSEEICNLFSESIGCQRSGCGADCYALLVVFWWKQVLNNLHALKKLCRQGRCEYTRSLKASVPQLRIWLLLDLSTLRCTSIRYAQWSSSASDAYLFTHEIFKDKKKDRASMNLVCCRFESLAKWNQTPISGEAQDTICQRCRSYLLWE